MLENKFRQKVLKAKENKNKLVLEIVHDLLENQHESQDYIKCLLIEALSKRTQKELKQINV